MAQSPGRERQEEDLIFPYLEMKRKFCTIGCDWEACHVGQNCRGCGPLIRMQFLVRARPVCAVTIQHSAKTVHCYHYDLKNPYPDTQSSLSENIARMGTGILNLGLKKLYLNFLAFMNLHGDITLRESGSHIPMGSMWYSVLTFAYVGEEEWTLIFIPDDCTDMYYLLSHCGCGGYQLRFISSYSMFIRPGNALPKYKLHNVGEGFTHTPELK